MFPRTKYKKGFQSKNVLAFEGKFVKFKNLNTYGRK